MQITERELDTLTRDLDEMHKASLAVLGQELEELAEKAAAATTTRRRFLLAGGFGAGAALALVACTDDNGGGPGAAGTGATTTTAPPLSDDARFIAMSASLENLAVATYDAAIKAVQENRLGGVPPAVVRFAGTVMRQHKDHADAFNAIVTRAGVPAVTGPDEVVKPLVDSEFAKVQDVAGLARLARVLENTAAATYQDGMARVSDRDSIRRLASVQPVERQHAAILSYILGEYPIPDTFSSTTKQGEEARPASDFKG